MKARDLENGYLSGSSSYNDVSTTTLQTMLQNAKTVVDNKLSEIGVSPTGISINQKLDALLRFFNSSTTVKC